MRLEVDISKKRVFVVLLSVLLLAGVVGVFAFGTSNPSVLGHSPGEIDFVNKYIDVGGALTILGDFRVDANSNTPGRLFVESDIQSISGAIKANSILEGGKKLCKEDGTNCPVSGAGNLGWVAFPSATPTYDIDLLCKDNGFNYALGRCKFSSGGVSYQGSVTMFDDGSSSGSVGFRCYYAPGQIAGNIFDAACA